LKSAREYTGIKFEIELFVHELSDEKNHESEQCEGVDKDGPLLYQTRCKAKTKDYKKRTTEGPEIAETSTPLHGLKK